MSLGTRARALVFATGIGQLLLGCQGDIPDHLEFALPNLSFKVSGSSYPSWPLSTVPVPIMICAGPLAFVTDCCTPPAPARAIDCQQHPVACDPEEKICALTFDVERTASTSLVEQVRSVAAIEGRVFSRVSLVDMTTKVVNSHDLAIRSASLYIGPARLGSSSDPEARLIAQVPLVEDAVAIAPSDEAQQAFSRFARDYRSSFSWLLAAHVVVRPGSTPSGDATFTVTANAEAWY